MGDVTHIHFLGLNEGILVVRGKQIGIGNVSKRVNSMLTSNRCHSLLTSPCSTSDFIFLTEMYIMKTK
jgi:hypothetical protein